MKTYEFEYLSEARLKGSSRSNYFMSAIDIKIGDCVVIEKIGRGIFLGRITEICDYGSETDYMLVGKAGKAVIDYIDALDKEKRKAELEKILEKEVERLDKEKRYAYYCTFDDKFKELYKEYKEL